MTDVLTDKVAVVTGGTTGIGLAIAQRFAAEGARVYITGRRPDALDAATAEIGHGVVGVQADSSRAEQLTALFDRVREDHGRIDVLVANAGSGSFAALGDISEEHYEATFDTNVRGTLLTVQGAVPLLADGASVILLSSIAGVLGTPAFSVYGATKAAISQFARSWVVDLKDRGIRVNTLAPGPVRTPGASGLVTGAEEDGFYDAMAAGIPLGRVADPAEIAGPALFLASDESSFVNGIDLFVDGGRVAV